MSKENPDPVSEFNAAVRELEELCSDIRYACDYERDESLPQLRLLWEAAAARAWSLYPAALAAMRKGGSPAAARFPTFCQQEGG